MLLFIKLYLLATFVAFIILFIYYKIYTFNKDVIAKAARKRLSAYAGGRYANFIGTMRDSDIYKRLRWAIVIESFLWWIEIIAWIRFKIKS